MSSSRSCKNLTISFAYNNSLNACSTLLLVVMTLSLFFLFLKLVASDFRSENSEEVMHGIHHPYIRDSSSTQYVRVLITVIRKRYCELKTAFAPPAIQAPKNANRNSTSSKRNTSLFHDTSITSLYCITLIIGLIPVLGHNQPR